MTLRYPIALASLVSLVVVGSSLAVHGACAQTGRSRAAERTPEVAGPAAADAGGGVAVPAAHTAGSLRIFFADVAGGQATLFVTPAGQSLLIDTGWPGFNGRDADRIVALAHRAGLRRIDTVLITHFHIDHVGGAPNLAARIPIGRFLDHGDNTEISAGQADSVETVRAYKAYRKLLGQKRIPRQTVKIGQILPIKGVRAEVVSAAGGVLDKPLLAAIGRDNPACATSPEKPLENGENDQSIGLMMTFGNLRILDLGDLTWALERSLVCPVNKLGPVDLFIVSHHGSERSNSPAFVAAIQPRVAIMDNGAHKGGEPGTFRTLEDPASGVGALWQLHAAEGVGPELNTTQDRMANRAGEEGNWIEVDAAPDGTMDVTNGRTGEVMRYSEDVSKHRT